MLAYVIMFVVMFAIKCVTIAFVKNKESTVPPGMAAPPVSGMLPPRSGSGLPYFKN